MVFCIRTERLILEDFNNGDIQNIRRIAHDPRVMRFLLIWLEDEEQIAGYLKRGIAESGAPNRMSYMLAAKEAETGAFAGISFIEIDPELSTTAEVGCVLVPNYWADGYASEILRALLRFGFDTLHLHRVYGKCDELNLAAARVLVKCGLRYEGTLREHVWLRDHWRSSSYFGILADEFNSPGKCPEPVRDPRAI